MFDKDAQKSKEPYGSSANPSSIELGIQRPVNDVDVDAEIELQRKESGMPPLDADIPSAPLDWDHPDDEKNPRNWAFGDRVFQTIPPALFSFVVTLASPIYTTATQQIQDEFNVSFEVALVPLTTHTLGFALGPMLAAPLSEMFGRKYVYLISFALFLLFTMASGLAPNVTALCIFRLIAGCVGAPALAVGAGTIGDIWDTHKDGGLAAMFFIMSPFLGSSLGPVFGGLISYHRTWRWTMWLVLLVGGPMFLWFIPFMKETYKPAILKKRAIERGQKLPPKPSGAEAMKKVLLITLFRPVHMLFTEPIVIALSLYTAFIFGVLFLFFAAIPYSFGTQYHFDRRQSGLIFISSVIGIILGSMTFGVIDRTIYKRRYEHAIANGQKVPVELRLISAMVGSLALPVSLFWFAWTCRTSIHWIVPTLSIIPFGFSMMLIFLASATYLVDTYQFMAAASALAANGLLRYGFGAVFPLFAIQMYTNLGIGMATTALGIIAVVLMAVPFVFYQFGRYFREKSGYDTLKG
ncbi:hypothetical protein TWF225_012103 [Orbilia oligospora]|uniref:Major facilitator superfamily (MFS) profile domain-containing protein n=1 Tax=Orbilia oligospora TaxID=2813651 RepID=A0A4Z0X955_ORBOL|nr:hypothetical protein TWF706_007798 [Orbilia oligospora]KAF3129541.1 hypothetical protein TWF703_008828 [Orbilia oligospora]KAF3143560.1 hypothetical protein TWF594_005109 [Orbilia oligospora]KAF3165400.1 hypothetical protein TWF788_000753 [Orbilia oligospora]KAF3173370.1 hypothetical protein TWF225_012103 [Orbilia oligospora]